MSALSPAANKSSLVACWASTLGSVSVILDVVDVNEETRLKRNFTRHELKNVLLKKLVQMI